MTEKELKKLNRKQLLELLLIQTSRADELEAQLAEAHAKLKKRELLEMEAGTMAEAALRINGVFEAVDAAAAQYIQNIKRLSAMLDKKVALLDSTSDGSIGPGWMKLLLADDVDEENDETK